MQPRKSQHRSLSSRMQFYSLIAIQFVAKECLHILNYSIHNDPQLQRHENVNYNNLNKSQTWQFLHLDAVLFLLVCSTSWHTLNMFSVMMRNGATAEIRVLL